MKVITNLYVIEELTLEIIRKIIESKEWEKNYYLTEGDLEYLIKEVKKILNKLRGERGVTSYYELKSIIRVVLDENNFQWVK